MEIAREAVAVLAPTDILMFKADVQNTLGEVLQSAGRSREAIEALRGALDFYERKGNVVWAERTRRKLREATERHTSGGGSAS